VTDGEAPRATILVVGFGNSLAGDDGAGPAVVGRLDSAGPPPVARTVEAGTDALDLAGLWRGEAQVWMVDAVLRGAAPGTIHRLEHEEVLAVPQRHATVHHLSLPECLRWLALAEPAMAPVRYRLYGIEPGRLGLGEDLSPAVARAVERLAEALLRELTHFPG